MHSGIELQMNSLPCTLYIITLTCVLFCYHPYGNTIVIALCNIIVSVYVTNTHYTVCRCGCEVHVHSLKFTMCPCSNDYVSDTASCRPNNTSLLQFVESAQPWLDKGIRPDVAPMHTVPIAPCTGCHHAPLISSPYLIIVQYLAHMNLEMKVMFNKQFIMKNVSFA